MKDKRGIISNRTGLEERPPVVGQRERIGDLEIDTIIGKNHKGAILAINDRVAGQLKMKKLPGKNADRLAQTATALLQGQKGQIHTTTADNGKEFAAHQTTAKELDVGFFFARPYHSWERGSNENLNGLIRQYIPKKTDFSLLTNGYIQWVEDPLNDRPRKRFNFTTPNLMFKQKVAFVA